MNEIRPETLRPMAECTPKKYDLALLYKRYGDGSGHMYGLGTFYPESSGVRGDRTPYKIKAYWSIDCGQGGDSWDHDDPDLVGFLMLIGEADPADTVVHPVAKSEPALPPIPGAGIRQTYWVVQPNRDAPGAWGKFLAEEYYANGPNSGKPTGEVRLMITLTGIREWLASAFKVGLTETHSLVVDAKAKNPAVLEVWW